MGLGTWSGTCWALTDDLAQATWPDFATQWARGPEGIRTLDFEAADVLDGYAMGALTRLLADWLDGGGGLVLLQPPQLVLHNLYRVGRYPHANLMAQAPRTDEPYG